MLWPALPPARRPTDKTYMRKPAEFLRSQLRLRIAVFGATIVVATSLALMGIRWWPASFVALGLLFVLERQAGKGRVLDLVPLRRGILGEEAVADVLATLPSSYWVLHGVWRGTGTSITSLSPPPLADAHVVGFGRPCQVACIHLAYLGRSGGRGGGALVERGVHPDLDIALEGSRDQAVLFGFMGGLVERGLIGTRNHTVHVEVA
jgi:hypothetical protein